MKKFEVLSENRYFCIRFIPKQELGVVKELTPTK